MLGEDFHTLINGSLFSSPTNVEHHIDSLFILRQAIHEVIFDITVRARRVTKSTHQGNPRKRKTKRTVKAKDSLVKKGDFLVAVILMLHLS